MYESVVQWEIWESGNQCESPEVDSAVWQKVQWCHGAPFDWRNCDTVWYSAHCVRLNRKWELGIFTKMSTSPLIFLRLNYFRHYYLEIVLCSVSLLMHIWVQVEHSLLCRQIYTWISCNSSRLHAGCVWTYGDELNGAPKKLILNIFDDLVSKIFGKYLHIQLS